MKRDQTKQQIAEALGVSVRTVERYVTRGCPHTTVKGRPLFSEAEVRRWRDGEALSGRVGRPSHADALPDEPAPVPRPSPTPPVPAPAFGSEAASKQNLAKAELARKISIAKKNELEVAAEKALRELGLDQKIRDARGFDDLARINHEVAALIASGALLPSRGQAIQRLMAEARQNLVAQQQAVPEQASTQVFLCTEEGGLLLRMFEGIVSDARRERIMALVRDQAEADLVENPNVDTAA
ncbi:MAG: helix-turn-helix domain-containing protein [Planctomycetes bacterium]|nr:helix-turn-helix domain-containing protein [Planctomycetota bacterium]